MREILFKAQRADNGEWVEGAYCPSSCDSPFGEMRPKPSIIKLGGEYDGFWFDVIPETVCQYTEVRDDSDEEIKIFEHDILEVYYEEKMITCKVKYEAGAFILSSNEFADGYIPMIKICEVDRDYYWIDGKVIGNIHDRSGNSEPDN